MMAILRYAVLKSVRDRSLPIFAGTPSAMALAILLGTTAAGHHLVYPLYIYHDWPPAQNAAVASAITAAVAVFLTSMTAFWTFRPEVATRAIGAFLMGTRAAAVARALVIFAAVIGIASWLASVGVIVLLTSVFPSNFAAVLLAVVIFSILAAAIGALIVTINTQPSMMIWAYLGSMVFVAWLSNGRHVTGTMVSAVVLSIVCTIGCAFLLERRCAT